MRQSAEHPKISIYKILLFDIVQKFNYIIISIIY